MELRVLRAACVLMMALSASQAAKAPNILFILADDMGQWAMGAYGNPEIKTPNLDRLASEGKRFENAYCNTPVCSASRASYFTGRLPSQHGVHDWIAGGNGCGGGGINYTYGETFYTDVLASRGYTCGISGKYHLGNQPLAQHSFSHWFVHQSGGGDYNDPPLVKDGQCVNVEGYITDILTDDAIQFMTNHTKTAKDKPFYLSVHYTAPHSPYTGKDGKASSMHPPRIVDMYANCNFSSLPQKPMNPYAEHTGGLTRGCLGNRECLLGYFAAVTAMDENVGRLMSTLDTLGIDEDTLVVFASDHGFNAGQHGLWGKGNAVYPLNLFETSLKVPMIFRHKGVIKPSVDKHFIQVVDVGPTLLAYAGNYSYPTQSNVAGLNLLPVLQGKPFQEREPYYSTLYFEYGQARGAHVGQTQDKVVVRNSGQWELFYLQDNPDENESQNFAVSTASTILEFLHAEKTMRDWFSLYEDPYISGWMLPVTGRGQLRSVLYNASGLPTTPAFSPVYPPKKAQVNSQCSVSEFGCDQGENSHWLSWWDFD